MKANEMRESIKSRLREGFSTEGLMELIKEAEAELLEEKTREDELAALRQKAATAMSEYLNAVYGDGTITVEEMFEALEETESDAMKGLKNFIPCQKVEVEVPKVLKITEEDFSDILKRLGF